MARKSDKGLLVALDIGTSKIAVIVAEVADDGLVEVIGLGESPSHGLKRGVVVDIESTVQSIQRAVDAAELMTGCQIYAVRAGIAGGHVQSRNSTGQVAIKEREVTLEDMVRVNENARAVVLPHDQQIIHVLPQEYIIDGQEGIRQPIGMSGVRLEVRAHLVTGATSAVQNIVKCIERCGLRVDEMVLEQIASAEAVLHRDERQLGVCIVDIGGGTTDIAVFVDGAIRHTAVIPIAGDQVTNDIAVGLRTPTQFAEKIKLEHASLCPSQEASEFIEVPGVGDRPARRLSRHTLGEIVEARYEEIFLHVREDLRRSGYEERVTAGVVLTGGSALMCGVVELAEEMLHMPVRLGLPQRVAGIQEVANNPVHATGVGLLLFQRPKSAVDEKKDSSSTATSVLGKMKDWFKGNF